MCQTNTATFLCGSPVSYYDDKPPKAGVQLCLRARASLLYQSAIHGVRSNSRLSGAPLIDFLDACGLNFGPQFISKMGFRLERQIRRWAKMAQKLDVPGLGWQGVDDAEVYLRQRNHQDKFEKNSDQAMSVMLNNLSLDLSSQRSPSSHVQPVPHAAQSSGASNIISDVTSITDAAVPSIDPTTNPWTQPTQPTQPTLLKLETSTASVHGIKKGISQSQWATSEAPGSKLDYRPGHANNWSGAPSSEVVHPTEKWVLQNAHGIPASYTEQNLCATRMNSLPGHMHPKTGSMDSVASQPTQRAPTIHVASQLAPSMRPPTSAQSPASSSFPSPSGRSSNVTARQDMPASDLKVEHLYRDVDMVDVPTASEQEAAWMWQRLAGDADMDFESCMRAQEVSMRVIARADVQLREMLLRTGGQTR
ncbi:hypothetical protein G7046_g6199 [Stylonectria norvegica]|nr:hypothetical protein G7046_g6199 [Stylonectria norvegica]